jgi:hypothetical protein
MPKGDIVGMFIGRVFLSLMARKTTMMAYWQQGELVSSIEA